MNKLNTLIQDREAEKVDINALCYGLVSVFLSGIGFTIIAPVLPFLVKPYVESNSEQAIIIALLMSVYAFCVFLAAPGLGALSDQYGRKPLLLICFLGSAIGYFMMGIGGALWVLFLGRAVDGITGGNISIIFAYFSDITPENQRTKYFGWLSAVSGVGVIIGPVIGGLLSKFGYTMPFYFGAGLTMMNVLYGCLFMPESHKKDQRRRLSGISHLNPLKQLKGLFKIKSIKRYLVAAFLLWIPNGALQAIFSQFTIDTFSWSPVAIGGIFSIMGIQDIVSQGLIMPKLLNRLNDSQIVVLGMVAEMVGYLLITLSGILSISSCFIAAMFVFGFGDAIFGPAFNSMLSKPVESQNQGQVMGGAMSLQALARIIGPIVGGQLYVTVGHLSPAFMGAILIAIAIFVLYKEAQKNVMRI